MLKRILDTGTFTGPASAALVVFFACLPALSAFSGSGGDFTVETSVVDNGGGGNLSGGEFNSRGSIAQAPMPDNPGFVSGGTYVNRVGFYNPPHLSFQKGLSAFASMPSGDVRLALPPNSVDKDRFDVTMNPDPLNAPVVVAPGKIASATSKLVINEGPWAQLLPGDLSEIYIFDEQDVFRSTLAAKGVLTMRYTDDNNDGIVDGSNPPVRVETLNTWVLDENRSMWVRLPESGSNPADKSISVLFGVPGVYAMLGAKADSVTDVYAFPVPFRPNGPQAGTGQGQTGTEAAGISFNMVPQTGSIEIYTIDGRLVRKFAIPENQIYPVATWDVKNASGTKAASGVYIWRVISGSNIKTGKLMVIW